MQGLSMSSLKKHPALIPLFGCIAFGFCIASGYTLRLALQNPDVSWSPKNKQDPWNDYKDKQYKFKTIEADYSKIKSPAPEY